MKHITALPVPILAKNSFFLEFVFGHVRLLFFVLCPLLFWSQKSYDLIFYSTFRHEGVHSSFLVMHSCGIFYIFGFI